MTVVHDAPPAGQKSKISRAVKNPWALPRVLPFEQSYDSTKVNIVAGHKLQPVPSSLSLVQSSNRPLPLSIGVTPFWRSPRGSRRLARRWSSWPSASA